MNETQRRRALADVKEFFLRAGALAALLLVLFGVVFGLAIQPDDTMYPHLKPGDLLLYYRLPRSFAAGEVVVFTQDDRRCTGRVAARGGDTVEGTENALLRINGSLVAEPDIYETTPPLRQCRDLPPDPGRRRVFYPLRRPRGCARQPPVRPGDGRKYRRAGHCDCEEE